MMVDDDGDDGDDDDDVVSVAGSTMTTKSARERKAKVVVTKTDKEEVVSWLASRLGDGDLNKLLMSAKTYADVSRAVGRAASTDGKKLAAKVSVLLGDRHHLEVRAPSASSDAGDRDCGGGGASGVLASRQRSQSQRQPAPPTTTFHSN
jgi:hypothetical protein